MTVAKMFRRCRRSLRYVAALAIVAGVALTAAAGRAAGSVYGASDHRAASEPGAAQLADVRRTYNGWGYSPLEQITRANVASLAPVWTFSTGSSRDHQSPPIVNEGRMFLTTPLDGGGVQVLALDAATGAIAGYHQYHHNGSWDWDEADPPLVLDVERNGRTIPSLVHPGRNGYLWLLERSAAGIGFVDATPYVHQNVFTAIDPRTGRPSYDPERVPGTGRSAVFCPSHHGAKNWPPAAFNPITRLLYIPANENLCTSMQGVEVEHTPGKQYVGARLEVRARDGAGHVGELQAWDLDAGKRVWRRTFPSHNVGSVLTTAGGLVFMGGTSDRFFRAFDAESGEELWRFRTNSGVIGIPTSFAVDGRQYIAVQSGWGARAQRLQDHIDRYRGTRTEVPRGGMIWVFALKR